MRPVYIDFYQKKTELFDTVYKSKLKTNCSNFHLIFYLLEYLIFYNFLLKLCTNLTSLIYGNKWHTNSNEIWTIIFFILQIYLSCFGCGTVCWPDSCMEYYLLYTLKFVYPTTSNSSTIFKATFLLFQYFYIKFFQWQDIRNHSVSFRNAIFKQL